MASLRELQRDFAAALRDPGANCAVSPRAHLDVYRNNSAIAFREALAQTFPVVRRRVGEDYFRQLGAHYRLKYPSRSGDLHFVGQDFPRFLGEYLGEGDYAWLADLARLEWLRSESAICAELAAVGTEVLARFDADVLGDLIFRLQPSLRLHRSPFPVFTVWLVNQTENAPPVEQSLGTEQGLIRSRSNTVQVSRLTPDLHAFISQLHEGHSMAEAMTAAGLDESGLTAALAMLFEDGLVVDVSPRR